MGTLNWLSLVTLVLLSAVSLPGWGAPIDRTQAAVNADIVLLSDIAEFRRTSALRAQLDPVFRGSTLAEKNAGASDDEITQYLIDERLILQDFPVKDQDVEDRIKSIQAENRIDRETLVSTLKSQGAEFKDYYELLKSSIAKLNLIDRDIRSRVIITDDDVKTYFYTKLMTDQASLHYALQIISVTPSRFKAPGDARETIERALNSVNAGESFEDVAKTFSDDTNALNGASFGVFAEDELAPAIRVEVKRLKIGGVTPILGTADTRYYFLRLTDIRSGQEEKLDTLKEQIRGQLSAAEYQRQITLWLERRRETAYIHLAGQPTVPKNASQSK